MSKQIFKMAATRCSSYASASSCQHMSRPFTTPGQPYASTSISTRLSSTTTDQHDKQYPSQFREMPREVMGNVVHKISALTSQEPISVLGYDFSQGIDYQKIIESMRTTGFQSSHFAAAVDEVNRMIAKKLEPLSDEETRRLMEQDPTGRPPTNCTLFLGYTSSIITCGLREVVCFLAKHNLIDCIVTTAGGIEEDFIKCLGDFYVGSFRTKCDSMWHSRINRAGNIFVPEKHYYLFTEFMQPILEDMRDEQENHNVNWTPSKMIARIGKEIDDESSVYYWAAKNNIPVYCPAITDGAVGDELWYFHDRNPDAPLRVDIAEDSNQILSQAITAPHTGMITLGAGIGKHHICQANAHRKPEGADYAVYINTAQEFDGSDSGALPDEAVTWGKIKHTASPVKVFGEATLLFPLLVAETFAKLVYPPNK